MLSNSEIEMNVPQPVTTMPDYRTALLDLSKARIYRLIIVSCPCRSTVQYGGKLVRPGDGGAMEPRIRMAFERQAVCHIAIDTSLKH